MSRIGFAVSMLAIVSVAGWTYHVNYETAEARQRVRALERQIAAEQERLGVLAVEWARLNAPERLRRLVAEHNGHLLLMPVAPDHFGTMDDVPWPPRPPLVMPEPGPQDVPADVPVVRAPLVPAPDAADLPAEQAAWRQE